MGRTKIDLTGQRFGRLVVVEDSEERSQRNVIWVCLCDCGNQTKVSSRALRGGDTMSCGCLHSEVVSDTTKKMWENKNHGLKKWKQERDYKEGTKVTALTSKLSSSNTSGVKGVSYVTRAGKWVAYLCFKGEMIYLGLHTDIQDAIDARKEAEEKYFKPILKKYGKDLE